MEPMAFDAVKVGIAVPTAGLIRAACTFSLLQLVGKLAQEKYWPEAKTQGLTCMMREGSGIAANREKMVSEALEAKCSHVLFVDDDMSFDPPAFESLARRRLPIVGCNYRMKFPPAEFTAVHLDKERGRMQTTSESTGLEPVNYMGFGLCLIETRVFEALPRPWFLGTYIDGVYTTEDLPFFWKAKEAGITAYCDQDASKHLGHIGIHDYRWHQAFDAPKKASEAG
jgi:hypothetical protein